jgi:hypothetical protein
MDDDGVTQAETTEATAPGPHGFPEETPVAEMTAAEQAAYWKFYSRRHEGATKAAQEELERLRPLADEAEKLRQAQLSEAEKAVEDARKAGLAEGEAAAASKWRKVAVKEAFLGVAVSAGLCGDDEGTAAVEELFGLIDPAALVTESGDVDRAKIVKALAPLTKQPTPVTGYGARAARLQSGGGSTGSAQAARERYAERHKQH